MAEEQTIYTFDDLIRVRAKDPNQVPLIAYPKSPKGISDYEPITGAKLNSLIDGATKALLKAGLQPVDTDTVAGIYGTSDLDYIITVLALGRLGYTTFILSPRLPVFPCVNLLRDASATILLYAPQFRPLALATSAEIPLTLLPILTRVQYDLPNDTTPAFTRSAVNGPLEEKKKLILMHSSGTTSLPRPINFTHIRLRATFKTCQPYKAFLSVPLFHAHGFVSFCQAIFSKHTIYLFNGNVAQTHDTIVEAIKGSKPEIVFTVPYVLKLLCEKKEGIEVLRECKLVSSSGSKCPDELGDKLVKEGIRFGMSFGATEVALILTSLNRPQSDPYWNYMYPPPHIAQFILMRPLDTDLLISPLPPFPSTPPICECIVLHGHPGKLITNSQSPPNSYHTSDLFVPHPTIPNRWKFTGRLDDRISLLTGEKVLPLPIEGLIMQHPLVREAVVFGVEKPIPGLLLFRGVNSRGLSNEEFLDGVWNTILEANEKAEAFSQIGREMVVVVPEERECASTDKSSIKRAQVYKDFKKEIGECYERMESLYEGTLKLDGAGLETWLVERFEELGVRLSTDQGFFEGGVDSLKVIQMRALMIRSLDLGGYAKDLASNVVYDCGNIKRLAEHLVKIRKGLGEGNFDETAIMEKLIEKYSVFETSEIKERKVVLLTGATGFLGSHLLAQLVSNPNITKIFCLLRTKTPTETAIQRLKSSLANHGFATLSLEKVIPLTSDLSQPNLNLPLETFTTINSETTHIIHCAWPVNFALPVSTFTPQIQGLHNLITLSLTPHHKKKLLFCSSVGVAMSTSPSSTTTNTNKTPIAIPSLPIPSLASASPTGYARSKLIAEKILESASQTYDADITILRIGQIIPAREVGGQLWNINEMIPLIIRSAITTGALPDIPGNGGDTCSWIDVATLSKTILEIGKISGNGGEEFPFEGKSEQQLVYNIVNPKPISWSRDFLPALKDAGLEFEVVGRGEWLERLKGSEDDGERNPSRKLLGFWSGQGGGREVRFETAEAEENSGSLRGGGVVVDREYVKRLVEAWKKAWEN